MVVQILFVAALVGALVWVSQRIQVQEQMPWKLYKWAAGPLPPSKASMMHQGLRVEAKKKRRRNAVVVLVKELHPGDTGWIHEDFIRSFGGHIWLHELSRVTSAVRQHNAGFVEIKVDEEGILVNIAAAQIMTEEEQTSSMWYFAMRFVPEEDEECEDLDREDGEDNEPASS